MGSQKVYISFCKHTLSMGSLPPHFFKTFLHYPIDVTEFMSLQGEIDLGLMNLGCSYLYRRDLEGER